MKLVGDLRRELAPVVGIEAEIKRIESMRDTAEWTALTSTDAGRRLAKQLDSLRSVVTTLRRREEDCATVERNGAALAGLWEIASGEPTPESVSSLAEGLTTLSDGLRGLDEGGYAVRATLLRLNNAMLVSTMELHGHSSRNLLTAFSNLTARITKLKLTERSVGVTVSNRMGVVANQLRR